MTMRGLVLITICLANALTAQAECCKCDCQQSNGLSQSNLYYLPIAPSHLSTSSNRLHQGLGLYTKVLAPNVGQGVQSAYSSGLGYHAGGAAAQYQVSEAGNFLDAGSKVRDNVIALGVQNSLQQPSLDYKAPGSLGSSLHLSSGGGSFGQGQVSQVSTHQGNHYINIEQQVSPHETSSIKDGNSLDHEEDHHHGKNDYYKFEYGVNDQHTHDIKSHKEEKKGDVVQGEYSLVEDNGNVRTVKYYADWKTGFHAQVHNSKTGT